MSSTFFVALSGLVLLLSLVPLEASKRAEYVAFGFKNDQDRLRFEDEHGFRMLHRIGSLGGNYYHMVREPWHPNGTKDWRSSPLIHWGEEQTVKERTKKDASPRLIRPDPMIRQQFHLGQMHVDDVWSEFGLFGEGITVGVVDDGLQKRHGDLSENYDAELSWDYYDNDADPSPNPSKDKHGTPCAGLVGAGKDNGVCGAGVAPRTKLAGIRLIGGRISDAQEAAALSHRWDAVDVYSNSWGPSDLGKERQGPGPLVQRVLEEGVVNGRGGKGSIWVWAAGNGRDNGDYSNWDGLSASRYTIAVAAMNIHGESSWYSERGSSLLVCAPSSGSGTGVTSDDIIGYLGYSHGDCTSRFGGTSAATPMVAGVVALLLERNPALGWRDVQAILIQSADSDIDKFSPEWKTNGAGRRVSHDHGYGLVDARAAIRLADPHSWSILPPQDIHFSLAPLGANLPRHFNGTTEFTYRYPRRDFIIEHVELHWRSAGIRTGDLFISLNSPTGTKSHLSEWNQHNNNTAIQEDPWVFTSVFHWDELPYGTWRVEVALFYGQIQSGTVHDATLWFYGRRRVGNFSAHKQP